MTQTTPPRLSGILLHPSSLPSPGGLGDLGAEAHAFVDWLARAGQRLWQILPLGPTGYGNSPYATLSAFAGNPLLIDLRALAKAGLLDVATLPGAEEQGARANYERAVEQRPALLKAAWDVFKVRASQEMRAAYHAFCDAQRHWLDDYAAFAALKRSHDGEPWTKWPEAHRRPTPALRAQLEAELGDAIGEAKFVQFLFFSQWKALRSYAASQGVAIMGDVPIFVAHDSADVWAHQELFTLDASGAATTVAGVPPDYFSETGQLWGNPLYRWDVMASRGFDWWLARIAAMRELVDLIRIDHFRGFEAFWEIPGGAETAIGGRWVKGPGAAFFEAVRARFGELPFIAEDLGVITPEVEALRDGFKLPGMRVLQFAFGGEASQPFLPHNHIPNSAVYLGTHDNDTTVGWLESLDATPEPGAKAAAEAEAKAKTRAHLASYLRLRGGEPAAEVCEVLIRAALGSVSQVCILSMQDVLSLGGEARMNTPGASEGNWEWRLTAGQLDDARAEELRAVTALFGRTRESEAK